MALIDIINNESDRRLAIAAFIILTILFLIVGLIGMLIRKIMQLQGAKLDELVSHAVHFRILEDEKHFRKYAKAKSKRLFFKQALPPILSLFVSLVFYLIYAGVSNKWVNDYWGEFSTLFFVWDFADEGSHVTFWGLRILAKWPPCINEPHFVPEYFASYILCSLWIVGSVYFFVVSQAYLSRAFMISHRAKTVYSKSLEGYNYYDSIYPSNGTPNPYTGVNLSNGAPISQNQQNPNNFPSNR